MKYNTSKIASEIKSMAVSCGNKILGFSMDVWQGMTNPCASDNEVIRLLMYKM